MSEESGVQCRCGSLRVASQKTLYKDGGGMIHSVAMCRQSARTRPTLRDEFAIAVLTSSLNKDLILQVQIGEVDLIKVADIAYRIADVMLERRCKRADQSEEG